MLRLVLGNLFHLRDIGVFAVDRLLEAFERSSYASLLKTMEREGDVFHTNTLEVLDGNRPAMRLYERCGFAPYQLDPAMGQARFLQKWL